MFPVMANFILVGVASGNSDHKRAMVPVTNGAATLVPPEVTGLPLAARLVMFSPGARSPCLPIEFPKFDWCSGLPPRSQATTGMTHGWRVIEELPIVP